MSHHRFTRRCAARDVTCEHPRTCALYGCVHLSNLEEAGLRAKPVPREQLLAAGVCPESARYQGTLTYCERPVDPQAGEHRAHRGIHPETGLLLTWFDGD